MTHKGIGDWGHLFVIVSFVASLVAGIGYSFTTLAIEKAKPEKDIQSWKNFSRILFAVHGLAVFGIIFCLYDLISHHYYEYHYAWSHSSNDLPWYFMISCFWEGQEGSFLLWIFWQVLLGGLLIKTNRSWEAPVLTVFCLVQAFLTSMILGTVIPGIDLKIGSSPFILLKDFMGDIPVFKSKPDFVPENGTGLNLLLQNYWMVIHPPTLFLGFALTLVPFSFCIAGLWRGKYREWINPALPWALLGALILGAGIIMGGYWAYETLNFGGYWNWDPVENAVYVPWLILVAAIHSMISYRNSNSALKTAIILSITAFLLILYSTYLTRSGVLGNASVHSFTDLGLKNQLFLYMTVFALISLVLVIKAWKHIPAGEKNISPYSKEFWIFIGITVLCLAAFQVIIPTSIPFFNSILNDLGIKSNLAPPAKQEIFYSDWQIWFAMLIAGISAMAQFFWWKKMDPAKLRDSLYIPVVLTLVLSVVIMLATDNSWLNAVLLKSPEYSFRKGKYILLWTFALFSIISNGRIFLKLLKSRVKLAGGAVAHIGVALMLIGILFSAGYSRVISLNNSGYVYSGTAGEEFNTENILLWRSEPTQMGDFLLTYKGSRYKVGGVPGFVETSKVAPLGNDVKGIAVAEIARNGKTYFIKGDTVEVNPENSYYEISYHNIKTGKEEFTLFPRIQENANMGKVVSPDIKRFAGADFYTHITSFVEEKDKKWSQEKQFEAKIGDTVILNDFIAVLKGIERENLIPGLVLGPDDAAIKAHFELFGKDSVYLLNPTYVVRIVNEPGSDQEIYMGQIPDMEPDLGLKLSFLSIHPQTESFTFSESTSQKDFIILKVVEKPLINILWVGTFVVLIGIGMAASRRYSEFRKQNDRERSTEVSERRPVVLENV